jgi:hypothetical protein
MRGCGLRPHPLIYPFLLLAGDFFSALRYTLITKQVLSQLGG